MKNITHILQLFLRGSTIPRFQSRLFLPLAAMLLFLSSARSNAIGIAATWQTNPLNGNWNNNANWSPGAPNGPSDTAIFASSSITSISITANTQVDGIMFDSGASAFTITASPALTLTISGVGITNNSGITQHFVTAVDNSGNEGLILFENSATAGSMTVFTNNGSAASNIFGGRTSFFNTSTAGSVTITDSGGTASGAIGGLTEFFDTSAAGSATITNNGAMVSNGGGGTTFFHKTSTAGSATINNDGGTVSGANGGVTDFLDTSAAGSATITSNGATVSGANGGVTDFFSTSTAGSARINNNGGTVIGANGSQTEFHDTSAAGSATLIANGGAGGGGGGSIFFVDDSTGGTARVEVFGNGKLGITFRTAPGVTVGSIEGSGAVFLGAHNLTVGSNKRSTTFSGVMQDGNGPFTGGSLAKVGKGKLSLTNANTYTGGTTVSAGTLLVKNKTGSGTGAGAVQVNAGTLGGTGIIAGAVTVGTGSSSGAILLPGNSATKPGTLTINSALTFNSLSTYKCVLNRSTPKAGEVTALGVAINSNVPFTFVDIGTGTLAKGTVFTVIKNTSANPIFGTFSNLADHSTFTSNGTTFKANYEGGTGNDLTLTVQ